MEDRILKLLGRIGYTPSNVPELIKRLGLRPNQQQELQEALRALEVHGQIVRTKGNRYILAGEADLVPGVIQITRQGKGFVQPDVPGVPEIIIPVHATSTALHGDRVLVRRDVLSKHRRESRAEESTGSVVRILERKRSRLVGTLQQSRQFLHVIPDDPRIPHHISVPAPRDLGRPANPGDKVVVELLAWDSPQSQPEGEIIEVLGPPDAEGVDMLSVLRQYNLPLHFPKNVLQEADAFVQSRSNDAPGVEELAGRMDCRQDSVITIDPDDAKDFDDAICLRRHSADQWKLWVHIADVSHYVRPGSALDTEARERGNSTYLVDRVIPMLPEALSNEICSLKPGVDRLTKCVEFLLTNEGAVLQTKFYPAVIHSKRRYSYQQVLACIHRPPVDDIERMVHHAHQMAQHIRRARFKAGSLDLDFPDTKIRLDDHGRVLRIEKVENDVSHQLIEEYMLLANEAVAGRLMNLRRPAVYRVHEPPKEKRLLDYRNTLLEHNLKCGDLTHRPEVQKLLQKLNTLPIGPAMKIGFLKSLMRARYAVEPLGHYGLSKAKYTHFTSPIRRYADLVVHRALFDKVSGTMGALKQIADHVSETERTSADAERDSKEVKLYSFLRSQLETGHLHPYSGLVTDVQNFGFFVDVSDLGMSGLVRFSSVEDDFFVFDPERHQVVGRKTHRVIKLGDRLTVNVSKVDFAMKRVDFQLAKTPAGSKPSRHRGEERGSFEKAKSKPFKGHQDKGRQDKERASSAPSAPKPQSRARQDPRSKSASPAKSKSAR